MLDLTGYPTQTDLLKSGGQKVKNDDLENT